MIILGIETSCDETAVTILDAKGTVKKPKFKVLGAALYSQEKIHAQYGGVFPNLAKREHSKNLIPLFEKALDQSKYFKKNKKSTKDKYKSVEKILEREPELLEKFLEFIPTIKKPPIDLIAVTSGPGLEPALWVGINFAKALGDIWKIPVIGVNHMEGHVLSVTLQKGKAITFPLPAMSLLISGGHTELVYSNNLLKYKILGKTRDDAVGEAYDKVARMLSLPYPGGPEISKLAEMKRKEGYSKEKWNLPRPMINTKDYDFSFSGLKTAVLYRIKEKEIDENKKQEIAKEFEDAITETLIHKTRKALEEFRPKSLVIGGGVISNTFIRNEFEKLVKKIGKIKLYIPEKSLATDNSTMIAIAGFYRHKLSTKAPANKKIVANGNLSL